MTLISIKDRCSSYSKISHNSGQSQFLIIGLDELLLLPDLLLGHLIRIVGYQLAHSAHHIVCQLPLDEFAVNAHSQHCHHYYCEASDYQNQSQVVLGAAFLFFGCPIDAVLRWTLQTLAQCLHDFVCIEIAPINHVIDAHFRKAVKPILLLLLLPQLKSGCRISRFVDLSDIHLGQDLPDAVVNSIPVTNAELIEQIHVLQPLLHSPLVEDLVLVQLLQNDLLAHVGTIVLVVVTTVALHEAVQRTTAFAVDCVVDQSNLGVVFQVFVVLRELPEKHVGAALGRRQEESKCAVWLFRDGEIGNDFYIFEDFQLLKAICAYQQTGYMHSFAIPVIPLINFTDFQVIVLRSQDHTFGSNRLSHQRSFCHGA